ncbi:MAG: hypothetical protein V1918_08815 [Planctomycetota bacterium]
MRGARVSVDKWILGKAGKKAVEEELRQRNICAQLTSGPRRRMNLIVRSKTGREFRIKVSAKQQRYWPQCKGIAGENVFLVLVDFGNKSDNDRPDFYVLTSDDWRTFSGAHIKEYESKHPDSRVELTDDNVSIFRDQINRHGETYQGCCPQAKEIQEHREAWRKIEGALSAPQP